MVMPGMNQDPRLQRGQPQQPPTLDFGQQVVVVEDGEPVARGTIVHVSQTEQGAPEYEIVVPELGTTITLSPDQKHQVLPAGQAGAGQGQPGMGPGINPTGGN